jgi:hypothetical protein
MKLKTLLWGGIVMAGAALAWANNRPALLANAPVDFTFSLTCRDLEGEGQQHILLPYLQAVEMYEERLKASGETMLQLRRSTNVMYYDTNVLIAYNHGLPDSNSGWDTSGSHVSEVTPNVIRIAGDDHGIPVDGFFDRHTGHGEIFRYAYGETPSMGLGASKIDRMFMLQCEPSKPTKF